MRSFVGLGALGGALSGFPAAPRCDQALEHTLELIAPAGSGLQFDDHLDSHVVLPGRP